MARRPPCEAEGCAERRDAHSFLCARHYRLLPYWICKAMADANASGNTSRFHGLRGKALAILAGRSATSAYDRTAALLGEHAEAAE